MRIKKLEDKCIVGEFHTHPDGIDELNSNDKKILRKLRYGFWIITTKENVIPWFYQADEKGRTPNGYIDFNVTCKRTKLIIK